VTSARETTLGGNQWLEEMERLRWTSETNEVSREVDEETDSVRTGSIGNGEAINVLLRPMEIRTFVVSVSLN
jgi:hypothetical protein